MYWKLKYLTFLDHEPCAVNDGKRLMAYLVDWFLSGLCLSLPMCLAWMMATKDLDQMEKVNVFRLASVIGDGPALAAAAAGLLLFLWYMAFAVIFLSSNFPSCSLQALFHLLLNPGAIN